MPRRPALALLTLAAAACVSPSGVERVPIRAADFRPAEVRQPAVVVRVTFAGALSDREREALPAGDEGALLEGLNARAVLAKDGQGLAGARASAGLGPHPGGGRPGSPVPAQKHGAGPWGAVPAIMACPVVVGWARSQKAYPFGPAQIAPPMTPNVRHESSVFNSEGRSPNNALTSSRMRWIPGRAACSAFNAR